MSIQSRRELEYEMPIVGSTIDAAMYLMLSAPERLQAFLDRHWPDGPRIERLAREEMAVQAAKRSSWQIGSMTK